MSASPGITIKKSRIRAPTLNESTAIEKLEITSSLVNKRGCLQGSEIKRASAAVELMKEKINPEDTYQQFLHNVQRHSKPQNAAPLVRLCAVALGKSAIRSAKKEVFLNLPEKIAALEDNLVNDALKAGPGHSADQPTNNQIIPHEQGLQRQISSQDGYNHKTPSVIPPDIFADDRDSVPLDLQLRDLIEFLYELEAPDRILRMRCPLSGDPLPSIYLGSQKFGHASAKLEFSQPLATSFMRYMMKRRQL